MTEKLQDKRPGVFFINNTIITEYKLPGMALAIYAVLCEHANRETGQSFPSRKHIGELIQCGASTVTRNIKILREKGLVSVKTREDKNGGQTSNLYTITPVPPLVTQSRPPSHTEQAPYAQAATNNTKINNTKGTKKKIYKKDLPTAFPQTKKEASSSEVKDDVAQVFNPCPLSVAIGEAFRPDDRFTATSGTTAKIVLMLSTGAKDRYWKKGNHAAFQAQPVTPDVIRDWAARHRTKHFGKPLPAWPEAMQDSILTFLKYAGREQARIAAEPKTYKSQLAPMGASS